MSSPTPTPYGAAPSLAFIKKRRQEEAASKAASATETEGATTTPGVLTKCIDFVNDYLGWIGFANIGVNGENYGITTVNVNPFGYQTAYVSTLRPGEGMLKCVYFRDAAGQYVAEEPNKFGELCNKLGKYFMSIKLFGVCGKNTGLVEVSVGPEGRLTYISLMKPGMGLTTMQTLSMDSPSMPPTYPDPPFGSTSTP
uniref:Uncharacterized protein n=2 Tax=Eukaryota TaxID=2759 RepID=A0A7S3X4N7_9SPIT|mmetsp:Transcript_8183/g.9881  ORF Transcript_8183/g.9881 Transcript_8183/m.9881 type:complete len:197 (-) Transcript_8183:521-1111(-)|eukprot:scaffold97137_cov40-Tisochrysis_lutea.AAC.2